MTITDQVLAALLLHGLPVLFGLILVCSIGLPFPVSLVLIAAGSFVEQGEMRMWSVILVSSVGAVAGDQIGYGLARWGGRPLIDRLSNRFGATQNVKQAEAFALRWSGSGIFFSRWLITSLGPWINVTSGIAKYPWPRFLFWGVLGEILWVVLYVTIGYLFSSRVQAIVDVLGDLGWVIIGIIIAGILGWRLWKAMGRSSPTEAL